MKRKIFKYAKKFLPLIGIILLILLIYTQGIEDVKNAFLRINPIYILIALSLTVPRLLIRNYAWQMIQKEQKINISFWRSLKIFLIGYFYGSFTPGYFGQLMRVPYMKETTGQPYGKLFVNVLTEIILRTISIALMVIVGALVFLFEKNEPLVLYLSIVNIIVLMLVLLFFIKKERGEKIFSILIKLLIPKKLKQYFYSFASTFYKDFPDIKKLVLPFFIGLLSWIIIFSQEYIFVIALDLKIPYIVFIFVFPIANMIGFMPITFAGLGMRDLSVIGLFTFLYPMIPGSDLLVVSIMGFLITDVLTGFVGFLLSLTEARDQKLTEILKSS